MLDLARSRLEDRTINLAGAHGDAGEADFELRIDGAGVSDEAADHLDDCMWVRSLVPKEAKP